MCAQISRIGSYTFEGNTCACSAACERPAGQELNPLLLLITPRLCNFRPAVVVGITFFAVRLRDFCSCLLLIMWHNKLPRNIEIEENRSTATAPDPVGEGRSAPIDPDAGGVRASCRRTQTSIRTQVLLLDLGPQTSKLP